MIKLQHPFIVLLFMAKDACAVSQGPVRKQAFSGKVAPNDINTMSPDPVYSPPKSASSIVREARKSGQASLDMVDSIPKPASSIVREAKKSGRQRSGRVAADGNIEMSHEELMTESAPSIVREVKNSGKARPTLGCARPDVCNVQECQTCQQCLKRAFESGVCQESGAFATSASGCIAPSVTLNDRTSSDTARNLAHKRRECLHRFRICSENSTTHRLCTSFMYCNDPSVCASDNVRERACNCCKFRECGPISRLDDDDETTDLLDLGGGLAQGLLEEASSRGYHVEALHGIQKRQSLDQTLEVSMDESVGRKCR